MTIAELEGKLSRKGSNAHERFEDLLTSDVFGTFLYTQKWDVLGQWLCKAENMNGKTLRDRFPDLQSPESVRIDFWPTSERREPDVVLTLTGADGKEYGLCVEAKYRSDKSQLSLDDEDDLDDVSGGEVEEVLDEPSGDQLHDQWCQIQKGNPYGWQSDQSRRIVVFVTGHASVPSNVLMHTVEAGKKCGATGLEEDIFWLGWCQLHQILSKRFGPVSMCDDVPELGSERMVWDLYRLLERKGLRYYRGYLDLEAPGETKSYPGFWNLFQISAPEFDPDKNNVFWENGYE